MKYTPLKAAKQGEIKCENLFGGTDRENADTKISNSGFKVLKNVWYKNGCLCRRDAYVGKIDCVYSDVYADTLTITDCVYHNNGIRYNFAYYLQGNPRGATALKILIVSKDGDAYLIGTISGFLRDVPESVFFITGDPTDTGGDGIFAFVKMKDYYTGEITYKIYKHVSMLEGFDEMSPFECYTPTVLMYGRGNQFPEDLLGDDKRYGTPTHPEQENLVNRCFKAYFTTDAYSYSFDLPIKNISPDLDVTVIIHHYQGSQNVLVFREGSREITFMIGVELYRASFDYEKGRVNFFSAAGPKPLPVFFEYGSNNLEIYASNYNGSNDIDIKSCKNTVTYNSRIYFFGSETRPNEIFVSREINPLYVPKNSKVSVGAADKVFAMGMQNDKVIAYKANEMYKISTNPSALLSQTVNQIEGSKEFILADSMRDETISGKTGCKNPRTLAMCSGQLIWLAPDKKVYTLETTTYGSEKNIFCISEAINDILKEIPDEEFESEKPFGFVHNGRYFLGINNRLFVCDCRIGQFAYPKKYSDLYGQESIAWYEWENDPDMSIICGKDIDGTAVLICSVINGDYVAVLENDSADRSFDIWYNPVIHEYEPYPLDYKIACLLESKTFDFNSLFADKIIEGVYIDTDGAENLNVRYKGSEYAGEVHFGKSEGIKSLVIKPPRKPTKHFKLILSSESYMKIIGIKIKYRAVNI